MSPVFRRGALQLGGLLLGSTVTGCLSGLTAENTEVPCETDAPTSRPTTDRWPMAGYGPTNAGYTPLAAGRDHAPTPETVASVALGIGGAVFGGDVLYLGAISGSPGRIRAVDAGTGERNWIVETSNPVTAAPALDETTVYAVSGIDESNTGPGEGVLHAVARDDGGERWRADLGGRTTSPPVVAGDHVFVGRDAITDSRLFAFDATTGEETWQFDAGDHLFGWPAVTDDTVYLVCADGRLYALDRESGAELWQFGSGSDHSPRSPPTVVDGTAFVGTRRGVVAVNACSGEKQWAVRTDDRATDGQEGVFAGVSVAGDTLYAPVVRDGHSPAARVVALDVADGSERWSTAIEPAPFWLSRPVVTDDAVYVGLAREKRGVRALAASDGTLRWESERGGGRPIVADGALYSADRDRVYSFPLDG